MKTTAQKVRDLLSKGKRPGDIANRLNISQSYVYTIKKQMQNEVTADEVDEVVEESKSELAKLIEAWDEVDISAISDPQGDDMVNSPHHYTVGGIETIDFIEAKGLGYHLGNVVKYISRSTYKNNRIQDLEKAKWYLNRAIEQIEKDNLNNV